MVATLSTSRVSGKSASTFVSCNRLPIEEKGLEQVCKLYNSEKKIGMSVIRYTAVRDSFLVLLFLLFLVWQIQQ